MVFCPPVSGGCRIVAGDVGLLQDLLKDLDDPETLKEVEKLMKVGVGEGRSNGNR